MVTVRLTNFGGSVTSPEWTGWRNTDEGLLDLINESGMVVTTFAKGSWSYVHNLEEPPEIKTPNYPQPMQPPAFEF